MALIQCPKCSNNISSDATICPHCGVDFKKMQEKEAILQIARTVEMPKREVINLPFILDIIISLSTFLLVVFDPFGLFFSDYLTVFLGKLVYSENIILFLVLFAVYQIIFVPKIARKFKEYNLAVTNFRKYQYKIAKQKYYKQNRRSYAFEYIISFLIPLVGIIFGVRFLTTQNKDDDYRTIGINCFCAVVLSILVYMALFL